MSSINRFLFLSQEIIIIQLFVLKIYFIYLYFQRKHQYLEDRKYCSRVARFVWLVGCLFVCLFVFADGSSLTLSLNLTFTLLLFIYLSVVYLFIYLFSCLLADIISILFNFSIGL